MAVANNGRGNEGYGSSSGSGGYGSGYGSGDDGEERGYAGWRAAIAVEDPAVQQLSCVCCVEVCVTFEGFGVGSTENTPSY